METNTQTPEEKEAFELGEAALARCASDDQMKTCCNSNAAIEFYNARILLNQYIYALANGHVLALEALHAKIADHALIQENHFLHDAWKRLYRHTRSKPEELEPWEMRKMYIGYAVHFLEIAKPLSDSEAPLPSK